MLAARSSHLPGGNLMRGNYAVVVLDHINVCSGIDPLFYVAAGPTEVAGYRNSIEVPKPCFDVVANTGRTGVARDFNDLARLALGAFVRVLHGVLPTDGS